MYINLVELLENGALSKLPEKIALIEGERKITFAQMANLAKSSSSAIIDKINSFNKPVAILLKDGIDTMVANLAVLYSGNFYTNLDIKSPCQRLRNIIDNVNPVLFVTDLNGAEILKKIDVNENNILIATDIQEYKAYPTEMLMDRLSKVIDTDPMCIINTSGSTGIPKSCILNHRGLIEFSFWWIETIGSNENDVFGVIPAFYFDIYLPAFFCCIYNGSTMVISPENIIAFPMKLAQYFADNKTTSVFWVPSILVMFVTSDILSKVDFTSLKTICFAGEVFNTPHYNYWKKHIPAAKYVNLYGPIEISIDCTYYIIDREFKDDEPLPIGYPCRNTDIMLIKDDNTLAAQGEQGELCIRGSSLALGYYNNPEKTNAAFVQNPLNPHYPEIIYKTGDLAYINSSGEIMFMGRKDFQIKHMGYRLELGEIEHLAAAIDGVKHVCILYNKDKKEITMFYEADKELTAGDIRTAIGKTLPKYALPTVFHFMQELPRNANGKIDRQALANIITGEQ